MNRFEFFRQKIDKKSYYYSLIKYKSRGIIFEKNLS